MSPHSAEPPESAPDRRLVVGDGDALVTLEGEFDLARADELTGLLALAVRSAPGGRVIVDMADVEFVDSTAMRVLLRAHREAEAGGGNLVLRNLRGHPRRMIELAGLHLSLTVDPGV